MPYFDVHRRSPGPIFLVVVAAASFDFGVTYRSFSIGVAGKRSCLAAGVFLSRRLRAFGKRSSTAGFTWNEDWRGVMSHCVEKLRRFLVSEDGPTAVEYAVMLALIVIVCLTAIRAVGTNASATFTDVSTQLSGS
jgi:pilus assembly protein Flp/PilA